MTRALLVVTLFVYIVISALAVWQHGYLGIIEYHMVNWAGRQVFFDLVIALVLVLVWLWRDARALGRNPWPWVIATLSLGSAGPLLYLMTRKATANSVIDNRASGKP